MTSALPIRTEICYNRPMSNNKDKVAGRKKALKEFLIGAAVAAVGGIATAVSYNSAKPGGSYTVYTGLIALGIVYAVIGLWGLIFPLGLRGNKKPSDKAAEPAVVEKADEAEVVKETEE